MGKYYDVGKVKERGKKLVIQKDGKQPRFNGRIAMVLDRTVKVIAPDVTNPAEYQHFYGQYDAGYWLKYDVYELPEGFSNEQTS